MVEWFENLSEGWQTAIFGAGVAVGLVVIGGLFGLLKWLFGKTQKPIIHIENVNVYPAVKMPDEIKEMYAKPKHKAQENENG